MKKIFKVTLLYSLALFSVTLVSCKGTGNKVSSQTANDSIQVADSLSSDSLDQKRGERRSNSWWQGRFGSF